MPASVKKTVIVIFIIILMLPYAVQAGNGNGPNKYSDSAKIISSQSNNSQNKALDDNISGNPQKISAQKQINKQNEIKLKISEKKQYMDQEISNLSSKHKNQNMVKNAVQNLLMAGDIENGIGKNISEIAGEFNNSVMSQYKSEEKILSKNPVSKFFFGGDSNAAEEILNASEENSHKINELKRLVSECECDDELKSLFSEQINVLEKEQNRLNRTASQEKKNKGFLGFLFDI